VVNGPQDAHLKNVHYMRVSRKAAHDALLAQEAGKIVRVKIGGQHLDRNRAVQHRLSAAVDDAEAAMTDLLDVVEFRLAQFRGDVSDQVLLLCKRVDVGHRRLLSSPWRPVASN
jgi:hypothetical protein